MAKMYQKRGRWYGNFRDLGGACVALKIPGERLATTHKNVARDLFYQQVEQLSAARKSMGRANPGTEHGPNAIPLSEALARFAASESTYVGSHAARDNRRAALIIGRASSKARDAAFDFAKSDIGAVEPIHVEAFVRWLRAEARQEKNGEPYHPTTQRRLIDFLRRTCAWAVRQGWILYDPTARLDTKRLPARVAPSETKFYTVDEAGQILRALMRMPDDSTPPDWPRDTPPFVLEQVALALFTGARAKEVRMQRWEWVDWDRGIIHIWTAKKKGGGNEVFDPKRLRELPLWPQLRDILRAYQRRQGEPTEGLMFPKVRRATRPLVHAQPLEIGGRSDKSMREILRLRGVITGGKNHIKKAKKAADGTVLRQAVITRDGPLLFNSKPGYDLGGREFRHTYCSTRLQTVEPVQGRPGEWTPVSKDTVKKEMGHASEEMVERVYAHVKIGPQKRLERVEYELSEPLSMLHLAMRTKKAS